MTEIERNDLLEELKDDEYDIKIADDAYTEYLSNGKQSRPISKLWEELDL